MWISSILLSQALALAPLAPDTESLLALAEQGKLNQSTAHPYQVHAKTLITQLENLALADKQLPEKTWFAIIAIAHIGALEDVQRLQKHLQHPAFHIRMSCLRALDIMHQRQLISLSDYLTLLHNQLTDKAMVVRSTAVELIGQQRDPQSLSYLGQELNKTDNFYRGKSLPIRKRVIDAMQNIGGSQALPWMIQSVADPDPEIAARAFATLNPLDTAAPLPDAAQRQSIQSAWEKIVSSTEPFQQPAVQQPAEQQTASE